MIPGPFQDHPQPPKGIDLRSLVTVRIGGGALHNAVTFSNFLQITLLRWLTAFREVNHLGHLATIRLMASFGHKYLYSRLSTETFFNHQTYSIVKKPFFFEKIGILRLGMGM